MRKFRPVRRTRGASQLKSDHSASHGADQASQGRGLGERPPTCIEVDYAQTRTLQSWSNQNPGVVLEAAALQGGHGKVHKKQGGLRAVPRLLP